MEQIENHMVIGDYYADRERQYDPDVVTADECHHTYKCDSCNLLAWCEDRKDISECKLCGDTFLEEDLFEGICKECLAEYVDPQTVKEYAKDIEKRAAYTWESLFETYFSDPSKPYDRCNINHVSETLKDRLMLQIVREYNDDAMLEKYGKEGRFHSKAKLVAWVGEDEVAWDDFAAWLVEKKGVLKTC